MANKKSAGKKRSAAKAQTKKPAELSPDKIAVKPETEAIQPKAKSEKSDKPEKKQAKKPNKAAKYFRDLRSEFKKVVWPSRKTVVNNTGVVLTVMLFSTLIMWGLDSGFAAILRALLGLAGS